MHKSDNRSPRVQRKRDARTQTILKAAENIVVNDGLDGLTIHRLARELDYAPGALYRYFPSKDAILAELSGRAVSRIHERLKSIQEAAASNEMNNKTPWLAALVAAAQMYAQLHDTDPAAYSLVNNLLGDPRHLLAAHQAERLHDETLPVLMTFVDLIHRAEAAGRLSPGPTQERAVAFWAGLQGIVQLRKLGRRASKLQAMIDPETIAHRFVHDLIRGWGASDEALARLDGL